MRRADRQLDGPVRKPILQRFSILIAGYPVFVRFRFDIIREPGCIRSVQHLWRHEPEDLRGAISGLLPIGLTRQVYGSQLEIVFQRFESRVGAGPVLEERIVLFVSVRQNDEVFDFCLESRGFGSSIQLRNFFDRQRTTIACGFSQSPCASSRYRSESGPRPFCPSLSGTAMSRITGRNGFSIGDRPSAVCAAFCSSP